MKRIMAFVQWFIVLRDGKKVIVLLLIAASLEGWLIVWLGKRSIQQEVEEKEHRLGCEKKIGELETKITQMTIDKFNEKFIEVEAKEKLQNARQQKLDSLTERAEKALSENKNK